MNDRSNHKRLVLASTLAFGLLIAFPVGMVAQDPSEDRLEKAPFEVREEELIANKELVEAGKLEILSRFTLATPLWNFDGLGTIHEVWAAGASDPVEKTRLKELEEFSGLLRYSRSNPAARWSKTQPATLLQLLLGET